MKTDNRRLYVVLNLSNGGVTIWTTKTDACRQASISVMTLDRHLKTHKYYRSDEFIVGESIGVNKNQSRVAVGKRINFGRG